MHRFALPGRASLIATATFTVLATISLLSPAPAHAAIPLQYLDALDWVPHAMQPRPRHRVGAGNAGRSFGKAKGPGRDPGHSRGRHLPPIRDSQAPASRIRSAP